MLSFRRKSLDLDFAVCDRPDRMSHAARNVTFYKDGSLYKFNTVNIGWHNNIFKVAIPHVLSSSGNYSCMIGYSDGTYMRSKQVTHIIQEEPLIDGPQLNSYPFGFNLILSCSYKDNNHTLNWLQKTRIHEVTDLRVVGPIYKRILDFIEELLFICSTSVNGKTIQSQPF